MKRKNATKSALQIAIEKAMCTSHTGKMNGMWSLSTSPLVNQHCLNKSKCDGLVRKHCFSINMQKMRKELKEKLIRNTELLTKIVIPVADMPTLNIKYFRFESFGDLNNEIQVQNYFNLCRKNKETTFALWTKKSMDNQKNNGHGYQKAVKLNRYLFKSGT